MDLKKAFFATIILCSIAVFIVLAIAAIEFALKSPYSPWCGLVFGIIAIVWLIGWAWKIIYDSL